MTIFELVKLALDQLYKEGAETHGDELDKLIIKRMEYLSASYKKLNSADREPVDYSDPATRFAYVYKYVAAHGDYIVQILQAFRDNTGENIFVSEKARVSCIGGGPGSDIIATLKYLDELKQLEPVKKVTCYLLDKEQAWADTWTELDESLNTDISLNANFQPFDVTDESSWKLQKKFLAADLFLMSYFVSEVKSLDNDGVVSKFWDTLFSTAKSGAYFLYDDNGHKDFNSYFDGLAKKAGLKCLLKKDNTTFVPRYNEQASELKFYTDKFGFFPKLKTVISYRIMQKP